MYKNIFKYLYQYLQASFTLSDALVLVQKKIKDRKYTRVLQVCIDSVKEGKSMHDSLYQLVHDKSGKKTVLTILRAAESSGDYTHACKMVYEYLQNRDVVKREFVESLTYPVLILTVAISISYGIVSFIFPKIIPLFTSLNVPIPLATILILNTVTGIEKNFILILLFSILGTLCFRYVYTKYPNFRFKLQTYILDIPGIYTFICTYSFIIISNTVSVLVSSNKSLSESLFEVIQDISFLPIQKDFENVVVKQEQGILLHNALEESKYFKDTVWVDLLMIGERTGRIKESFTDIYTLYTEDLVSYKKIFKTWSEPVLMLCIALIVLFIALSVIQPMYSIVNHVSNT